MPVEFLVLHYTGMRSAAAALARLCEPEAAVSAHYVVLEDGTIVQLVPEAERAWHAGVSSWRDRTNLNDTSIGIEIVNPGHEWGYRPFPEAQMVALAALSRDIRRRWPIPSWAIVGHSDISPARKEDPGELFDWRSLAQEGLGLWPVVPPSVEEPDLDAALMLLALIGYAAPGPDLPVSRLITAFQRRYRPSCVDGELDAETMGVIRAVACLYAEARGAT